MCALPEIVGQVPGGGEHPWLVLSLGKTRPVERNKKECVVAESHNVIEEEAAQDPFTRKTAGSRIHIVWKDQVHSNCHTEPGQVRRIEEVLQ